MFKNDYDYNRYNFVDNFNLLNALNKEVDRYISTLSSEERAENKRLIAEANEKKRVEHFVNKGMCPDCGSKLSRGKKDKHNNYKRLCICVECGSQFTR